MKRVINFVKGKREEKKDNKFVSPPISVEITNPAGQKIQSEDEHILGLQSGYGYQIDINGKDKNMTKLHKSAWQGNLDKVKVNLKKTDVNLADHLNRTALHFAAAQGHSNVAWFLLSAKASLDIRDSDGMTPFLKAIECGNKECVNMLLERGADVNIVDRNGNNGLHLAAKLGFFNIASLLLKKGANFDCSNNVGEFPLHLATEGEHRELVDLLLHAGAHVNVIDRDNRTPLMLAARYGFSSLVSLFLEHNASLEACDSNGWTAEDYALIGGHQQLAIDLKVPGREQLNKEGEQIQEAVTSCEVINEVDSDLSDNMKNILQTAEVEINANPSELKDNKQHFTDSVECFIDIDDDDDDPKDERGGDKKEDTDTVESPRSCVTPPPLQPPRSWDLIQAGMIDEKEVQRRSLTALGTLRSRRESFNENGGTSPHSPHKGQGDFLDIELDENLKSKISGHKIIIDGGGDANSLASEESLPLDKLPSTPECHEQRPKSRLERAPSVDLTEEDPSKSKDSVDEKFSSDGGTLGREDTLQGYEEIWEKNDNINDIIDNVVKDNNNTLLVINTNAVDNTVYDTGQGQVTTEISDQFLLRNKEINNSVGYVTNEIYRTMIEKPNDNDELVSNTQFIDSNINQPVHVSSSLDNLDDYKKSFIEIESSRSCNNLDDKYRALEENLCCGIYSSDTMTDVTSPNENEGAKSLDDIDMSPPLGTVVKRNVCREVHSLDMLDDIGTCCGSIVVNGNESKPLNKRHARNKSVSVNSRCWSKSFDVLSKPSNIDKVQVDTKKIDAQLECYDEALRELAQDEMLKRNSLSRMSKDSYTSSDRKSETFSSRSGYFNSTESYLFDKDKHNINGLVCGSSSSSSQQRGCDYFLKLNDNKDFKINRDSNNIPVKVIDKSKSVDCISTDSSDKISKCNFVEDYHSKNNEMRCNYNENSTTTIESNFDISLQDLPPPPPELTFNPNILSENDVYPLTKENVDFLTRQNVGNHSKCQEKINVNNNNVGDEIVADDDEEANITKEFEKSLYKLEKDLYNINTCVMKPFDEKLPSEHVIESNLVVLPVECSMITVNKTEIPVESRNGDLDVNKCESSNISVSCIVDNDSVSKHADDDSSSTMDRSAEEESPKPPPRPKKSLRKGRSEGEMRNLTGSKNTRSYSTSMYNDIVNEFILDKSNWMRKKSESEAPAVNEKSESDSELCERPLRRKRKILLAMRGIVAGSKDSDDDDTSTGDPPFWLSTEKGGHFARQDTVVSMPQTSRPNTKQPDTKPEGTQSTGAEQERLKEVQNEGEKPWTSSDGDTASGSGEVTPGGRHSYTIRSHHTMLKEHLRLATNEKTLLEESVANLRERLERINYELADALQAIAAKDDCISILEEQVRRLEAKYSNVLDEYQTLQHCVTTQEVELKHLREHCEKVTKEKAELREQILNEQKNTDNAEKCTCVYEEKKRVQEDITRLQSSKKDNLVALQKRNQEMERRNEMLVAHLEEVMRQFEKSKKDKEVLESQNITDIEKLQQDTLMWKEKYEECHGKLERVGSECRPRLEEAERTIVMLQSMVQKLEAEKKYEQENWKSKFMDELNLVYEVMRKECDRVENLLNDKIRLLENNNYRKKSKSRESTKLILLWKSKSAEITPGNFAVKLHSSKSVQVILPAQNEKCLSSFSSKSCSSCSDFDSLNNLSSNEASVSSYKLVTQTTRILSSENVKIRNISLFESVKSRKKCVKEHVTKTMSLDEISFPVRLPGKLVEFCKSCQFQLLDIKSCQSNNIVKCCDVETIPLKLSFRCFCNRSKCFCTDVKNSLSPSQPGDSIIIEAFDRENETMQPDFNFENVNYQMKTILLHHNLILSCSNESGLVTLHCENVKDGSNVSNRLIKIKQSRSYDDICCGQIKTKEETGFSCDLLKMKLLGLNEKYEEVLKENEILLRRENAMDNYLSKINEKEEYLMNKLECLVAENDALKFQLNYFQPSSDYFSNINIKKTNRSLTIQSESISYVPSCSDIQVIARSDKTVQVTLDGILTETKISVQNELLIKKSENIETYIRELEEEVSCIKNSVTELLDENYRLKDELTFRENEIRDLVNEINTLKNHLSLKDESCKHLENALCNEKCNSSLLRKQLHECKVKINELNLENQQIIEMEERVNSLKGNLDQTKSKIMRDERKIKELLNQLSNFSDLSNQNSQLNETVIEQKKIIHEMKKQFGQLRQSNLVKTDDFLLQNNFSHFEHNVNSQLPQSTVELTNGNIFICRETTKPQFSRKNSGERDARYSEAKKRISKFNNHCFLSCSNSNLKRDITSDRNSHSRLNERAVGVTTKTLFSVDSEQNDPLCSKMSDEEINISLLKVVASDRISTSHRSVKYNEQNLCVQNNEKISNSNSLKNNVTMDLETPSKPVVDNDYFNKNSSEIMSAVVKLKNYINRNETEDHCISNGVYNNPYGDQTLDPYACFFFSTLPFDPTRTLKKSLTGRSSVPKSSTSLQPVNHLKKQIIPKKYDQRMELLYKRHDPSTSTSRDYVDDVPDPSLVEYSSFLPSKIIRSLSVCSFKSASSKTRSISDDASSLTMPFLIPFDNYYQKFSGLDKVPNLSNNVSSNDDRLQNSENEIIIPITSTNVDLLCQASSSSSASVTVAQIEPQLTQLQQKLESESGKRQSLEMQVNKLIVDLQEKLNQNKCLNQRNVLSHENQEVAVGRMRQQALLDSENNLSEKISQINTILQQQMEEQDRLREHSEMQMKKEFEMTRQKLLFELSRVQTALKAKEAEERMLREKCDKLTRDVEKSAELKRKQLLEKSYSINLAQKTGTWEKELSKKQNVVVPPPPPPPVPMPVIPSVSNVAYPQPADNLFSHEALRAQLHDSITKHRGEINLDQQSNTGSTSGCSNYENLPETSSKR